MAYDDEVLADAPRVYLKLDETSGTAAVDAGAYATDWAYGDGVVLGQPGLVTDGGTAVHGDGAHDVADLVGGGFGSMTYPWAGGAHMTFEVWVDTGGIDQLCYLTNLQSGTEFGASGAAMNVALCNDAASGPGKRVLAVVGDTPAVLISTTDLASGPNHIVVVQSGASGGIAELWVNGVLEGSGATTGNTGDAHLWHGQLGPADALPPPASVVFDCMALYDVRLSALRIAAHHTAGTEEPTLLRARGRSDVAVAVLTPSTSSALAEGRSRVYVKAAPQRRSYEQRAYPLTVITMPTAATVDGVPTVPAHWGHLASSGSLRVGAGHIRVIPAPASDTPKLPFPIAPPPPPPGVSSAADAIWRVADLPSPGDGFYWLGDPSYADGTGNIQAGARQWASATPGMPAWRSAFPFKPSVTAVDHYLQGGGIVHHPKGVNFNSHFIEHMWANFPAFPEPFSWVVAGCIASWPSDGYEHTILEAGRSAAYHHLNYGVSDVWQSRSLPESSLGYHNLLAVSHDRIRMTGGSSISNFLAARHRTARVPTMWFGVYDGAKSRVGAYRKGYRSHRQGRGGDGVAKRKYIVLGRRRGVLAQGAATHMLVFEIRLFLRALSLAELDHQYDLLSSAYKFNAYS